MNDTDSPLAGLPGMRRELLELHRALVDSERREYERVRGRLTDRAFLDALIRAPELAWLNPLTSLIVRLEEVLEEAAPDEPLRDCLAEIRNLLRPAQGAAGFHGRYADALQRSPEVVVAHGRVLGVLTRDRLASR